MPEMPPGHASRVAVSIIVRVGWLIFLVIFLAFYAEHFSIYKNLAIIVASILVMFAILAPIRAYSRIKYGWRRNYPSRRRRRQRE